MRLIWLLLIVLAVVACLMDLKCEFCRQSCKTEAALKLHRRKYCSGRQQIVGGGIQKARDDAVRAIAVQRQHDKAARLHRFEQVRAAAAEREREERERREQEEREREEAEERMNAEYSFVPEDTPLSFSRSGRARWAPAPCGPT
ncbi:hypothetical protein A0H81_07166 [Grifola frondosa]|uniref:C2H2-type domain-containing protein n=1 Tax=Grifola frondosa TaxID=5627 RepID=A0A1C7MDB3_GRIFR|nr:hypothetical protein A0H81_07166 [Grifola frondosa]